MRLRSVTAGRTSKRSALLFSTLMAGVLLATTACSLLGGSSGSSSSTTNASAGLEKTNITVGVLPVIDDATIYIAQQKGYFKAQGLNVKLQSFQTGGQALTAMAGGSVDFANLNWVNLFAAIAKGAPDLVAADGYQATNNALGVITMQNSGIKTPADLAGKTVGTHLAGNIVELCLRAILQANNVDAKNVHFDSAVLFPQQPEALVNGTIQAGADVEPYLTEAEKQDGAVNVINLATGPTANIPLSGYATTKSFASKDPKTLAAFQRAMQQAAVDATNNVSDVRAVLPSFAGVSSQIAQLVTLGTFPTSLDASRLQRVADLMQTYGYLTSKLNVSQYVVPYPSGS